MWLLLHLVQLSLFAMSFSASVRYNEICPEIKSMADLELSKWATGTWYQLYNDAEDTVFTNDPLRCIERRHFHDEEAQVILQETYRLAANGNPQWFEKVLHVSDNPGLFHAYAFNHSRHFDRAELRVLDTDYETYSVTVVCALSEKLNKKYFTTGIDSRAHVLPHGKVKEVVDMFRHSYKTEVTYSPVCFKDCRARC